MIMFKYSSKVNVANPKSNSLRAGIPKEIVKVLGIGAGDIIEWNVDVVNNDEFRIIVKKKEQTFIFFLKLKKVRILQNKLGKSTKAFAKGLFLPFTLNKSFKYDFKLLEQFI